jgi:hypothetical protein
MDLITHMVATRRLLGSSTRVLLAGVLADAPFI